MPSQIEYSSSVSLVETTTHVVEADVKTAIDAYELEAAEEGEDTTTYVAAGYVAAGYVE